MVSKAKKIANLVDRLSAQLGAQDDTEVRHLIRMAIQLYASEWGHFDIEDWLWPFAEVSRGLKGEDVFWGVEAWTVLFRKAWELSRPRHITTSAILEQEVKKASAELATSLRVLADYREDNELPYADVLRERAEKVGVLAYVNAYKVEQGNCQPFISLAVKSLAELEDHARQLQEKIDDFNSEVVREGLAEVRVEALPCSPKKG